jgi:TRAP-type C4-dicarboxylate transport system permease small subunit
MARLGRAAGAAERLVHRLSGWIKVASQATLFLMMCFVAADVFARFVLVKPIRGDMDVEEMMMVLVVFLAMPFCTYLKGHIHVELLVDRLTGRSLTVMQSLSSFIGLAIIVLIAWQAWVFGWRELFSSSTRTTMMIHIPLAPFIIIAAVGYTVMALELLIGFIHTLGRAVSPADR